MLLLLVLGVPPVERVSTLDMPSGFFTEFLFLLPLFLLLFSLFSAL